VLQKYLKDTRTGEEKRCASKNRKL